MCECAWPASMPAFVVWNAGVPGKRQEAFMMRPYASTLENRNLVKSVKVVVSPVEILKTWFRGEMN